jgi:hypothetical protein
MFANLTRYLGNAVPIPITLRFVEQLYVATGLDIAGLIRLSAGVAMALTCGCSNTHLVTPALWGDRAQE